MSTLPSSTKIRVNDSEKGNLQGNAYSKTVGLKKKKKKKKTKKNKPKTKWSPGGRPKKGCL